MKKQVIILLVTSALGLVALAVFGPAESQVQPKSMVFLQPTTPGIAQTGNSNITGFSLAGSFVGNGSLLANLNASSLVSGTLPSARLSGTYSNSIVLNNPANVYSGDGSLLANIRLTWPYTQSGSDAGTLFSLTNSSGTAIYGQGASGRGVYGKSSSNAGVYAETTSGTFALLAINGTSSSFAGTGGVYGFAASSTGVYGQSTNGRGLYGKSTNDIGIWGETSSSNYAVVGMNLGTGTGGGVFGQSPNGRGLYGKSTTDIGIWGETSSNNYAVVGVNLGTGSGGGVYGQSASGNLSGLAIYGLNPNAVGNGIAGECRGNGTGVTGRSVSGVAVAGFSVNAGGSYYSGAGVNGYSVNGFGVVGITEQAGGNGVVGLATNGGYGVYSLGNIGATGAKLFEIDHPLDPENKYLDHYCAEGPQPLLIYRGNTVLDGTGQSVVELPEYFEAINRDFTYQLTPVGDAAPNLHVKQKIQKNQFRIAGGKPGLEVSWTVSGVRNDRYMQVHGAPVERFKPEGMRGRYLHPELYERGREMAAFPLNEVQPLTTQVPTTR